MGPLDLSGIEVQALESMAAESIDKAINVHTAAEVIVHLLVAPDLIDLPISDFEQGTALAIIGGNKNPIAQDNGICDVDFVSGLPGKGPGQLSRVNGHSCQTACTKDQCLVFTVPQERDSRGIARHANAILPSLGTATFIKGHTPLADIQNDKVILDHCRTGKAPGRFGQAEFGHQVFAPVQLACCCIHTDDLACSAAHVHGSLMHGRRSTGTALVSIGHQGFFIGIGP